MAGRAFCEGGKVIPPAVTFESVILGYQDEGNSGEYNLQRGADFGALGSIRNDAGLYDGECKSYLTFVRLVFNWHHSSARQNAGSETEKRLNGRANWD